MFTIDEKTLSAVDFIFGLQKFAGANRKGMFSQRMVTTNGCFDILTAGHVKYLEQAATRGSLLVVLLNSDASVQRLKGENRPFVCYEHRAMVLAGLQSVRNVIEFHEDTPAEVLELMYINGVGPEIHVKGGDYVVPERFPVTAGTLDGSRDAEIQEWYSDFPEAEIVHRYGGEVVTIPFEIEVSTSQTVARICKAVTGNTYAYKKREE